MSNVNVKSVIHLIYATVILSKTSEGFSKHETKTQDEKKKWILLNTLEIGEGIESTFLKKDYANDHT